MTTNSRSRAARSRNATEAETAAWNARVAAEAIASTPDFAAAAKADPNHPDYVGPAATTELGRREEAARAIARLHREPINFTNDDWTRFGLADAIVYTWNARADAWTIESIPYTGDDDRRLSVGDLAFTVGDVAVRIDALSEPFPNGMVAALVRYHAAPGTVGIESARDLLATTHAEDFIAGGYQHRPFRKADETAVVDVPGVKVPAWAR